MTIERMDSFALERRKMFLALGMVFFAPGCAGFGAFHASAPAVSERAATDAAKEASDELERLASTQSDHKISVCFIGVSGASNRAELSDAARELLEQSGKYKMFGKEETQTAFKKSGVDPNDVFIPIKREKFEDALGSSVDYFLAGYVEAPRSDDEESEKNSKRRVFKLELVEVKTNKKCEFVSDLK